jgi:hypothetical protein
MAGLGWFCGFFAAYAPVFLVLGLIGGIVALNRSPHRNRAIAGVILNALGRAHLRRHHQARFGMTTKVAAKPPLRTFA